MNYEYTIAICIAMFLLMLWVDIALRRMLKRSGSAGSLKCDDWNMLFPTGRLILDEVESEPLPRLAIPRGAIVTTIPAKTYFLVHEGMFYSVTDNVFTNHPKHPHYVALNFV